MRKLLEEVMQIDGEAAATLPAEPTMPEITPELMASLVEQLPELADVDQAELEKGMGIEMEHYNTVGQDMLTVAKIALDHIKEFAGKSYYGALEQMEHELKETPGEEEAEHLPGGEEVGGEAPAGELPTEETPMESKIAGVAKKLDEKKKKKNVEAPKVTPKVETATNEEAQTMVDKGEATIPPEAVVPNPGESGR